MTDFFEAVDFLTDPDETRGGGTEPTLIGELAPYWKRYTADAYQQAMQPIRIIVEIDGLMAGYDNPTLDGILARMVTDEALEGDTLDGSGSPYLLPVPLFRVWTDPKTGLPLWASNNFQPHGPNERTAEYWHKRAIRPDHARKQKGQKTPYPIKGRYKEKRVPLPAQTARTWWADAIADAEEVFRLMSKLEVMGKKRKALVRRLQVRPIDEFRLARPIPLRYFGDADVEEHGYMGWTPPYWAGVPQCQALCGLPPR